MERVTHVLAVYDGISEEIIDVVKIVQFNLAEFIDQFDVDPERDPQMEDRYAVGPDDLPFLGKKLANQIAFDLSTKAYFVEAVADDFN